ncbi:MULTISPECIES: L-fucose:H+ symporter permease [Rahnella]|jgi:FHS family L-fucose permease-like MFS transporter|uniref:L-fucose transporter n=1 Tax=Rahnella sp. (strain Y9602) TaxID=2703885 RepID=A0A0H3FMI6_RAHSY|nr:MULTISPECIES: L-fucose:H+ symporter permease [Rahnella]MDP9705441.1 FHS family L-fucose permease-like MFS transporter [Rahnella aquatilis]ADW76198.1 L-fucose transporter [Rahnella aceris]MBU9864731.1 L-fucose:H+ symporter permease [Rahnella aceris]MCM2448027.1 L-fucose:H+ symporter permease [Rahnella sp. CG8]MQB54877.1 L-fucose:H+ symporter permease [Rahnella sp. RcJ3]
MLADKTAAPAYAQRKTTSGFRLAFILVTTLFFLWGLSYGLLDVLNKHFQDVLHVNKAQSGLLQAAYFGAYFIIALPAGFFMDRFGYKAGILVGLCLYALGALLFVPAASAGSFGMFLFALFVIALGLGCLETAANPFATVLGDPAGAERRLNLSQSFNGLGQFIGPIIGGSLFFSATQGTTTDGLSSVKTTYVAIAVLVLLIAFLFGRTKLPDIREQSAPEDHGIEKGLWQHGHFTGGVIAQFFYVAAQVGVGAFFINYTTEHWHTLSNQNASYLLSVGMISFMVGRFFSTWLMGFVRPATLLVVYAIINIVLCGVVVAGIDNVSVIALVAIFFFMSIMFPTIFAMGVKNMGKQTKRASSVMIMAIVGGAVMPYLMGAIADHYNTAVSYALPMVCFAVVLIYAVKQRAKAAI